MCYFKDDIMKREGVKSESIDLFPARVVLKLLEEVLKSLQCNHGISYIINILRGSQHLQCLFP